MTMRRVLVTGGAGFIGSHLVAALRARGHRVRVLDVLDPQVHGRDGRHRGTPEDVEMLRGDILDEELLGRALEGIEVLFHQAASVGVGQSMYEAAAYTRVNSLGTALLMQRLAAPGSKVEKVVVASSMSLYGEGYYSCPSCGPVHPQPRSRRSLSPGEWEPACPRCKAPLEPLPTAETVPPAPTSIYAITKRCQEETVLVMGRAYGIPAVALRYFNVYGPGQALSNPYTGVAAIFASRLLNGAAPILFEDGMQSRDFIHVSDIVRANLLAMEKPQADGEVFNVGTGRRTTLLEMASSLAAKLRPQGDAAPQVAGTFREGDIRHCFADVTKIGKALGFEAAMPLERGYEDLAEWARTQKPQDFTREAVAELEARGLVS
ncbi:MAG TPA: NAD-dependent epimerase/dehydratase family protein [Candidatus Polarisedimenticolia bacterium]|nr:NAD-dependent epimerase/dehydratase family protein [Candidatus Polarisedimenticolia bacterium]